MIYFAIFVLSFLLSIAIVPLVIRFSYRFGFVDKPNDRKIHVFPISMLGGVSIFLSSAIGFSVLMPFISGLDPSIHYFLLLGFLAFLLGLFDDLWDCPAKYKLLFQLLIGVLTFVLGFRIENIHFGVGQAISLGFLSLPITALWVALIMNAFNMIDGMDGLASSYVVITLLALSFVLIGQGQEIMALFAMACSAASLGFFLFNFHPAKIFMGDAGSQFLGYTLSVLSIKTLYPLSSNIVWIPLIFLSYPLLELVLSMLRRSIGQIRSQDKFSISKLVINSMRADSNHFHHRLLKSGLTQRKANLLVVIFSLISCAIGFVLMQLSFLMITFGFILYIFTIIQTLRFFRYEEFHVDTKEKKLELDEYEVEKKINPNSYIRKV